MIVSKLRTTFFVSFLVAEVAQFRAPNEGGKTCVSEWSYFMLCGIADALRRSRHTHNIPL